MDFITRIEAQTINNQEISNMTVPTLRRERPSDYGMFEPDFQVDVYNWFYRASYESRIEMIDALTKLNNDDIRFQSQSPVQDTSIEPPSLCRTESCMQVEQDETPVYRPSLCRTNSCMQVEQDETPLHTPPLRRTDSVRPFPDIVKVEENYQRDYATSEGMLTLADLDCEDDSETYSDMPPLIPLDTDDL